MLAIPSSSYTLSCFSDSIALSLPGSPLHSLAPAPPLNPQKVPCFKVSGPRLDLCFSLFIPDLLQYHGLDTIYLQVYVASSDLSNEL